MMKDLICPLCTLSLMENSHGLVCENRHQFDRAKEGYFNLLPVQFKNSREPGDAKAQLQARKIFLAADYFFPLVQSLQKKMNPELASLLDIGCGEGYFTRAFRDYCSEATVYGLDIAKAGIRLAAKNNSARICYAVASSSALPFADASMSVIVRIYAPSKDAELQRVLKPDGQLIVVTPGEQHLIGLRKNIYQTIRPHQKPDVPLGFHLVSEDSVEFSLSVPPGQLSQSLLAMTPFAWKLRSELQAAYIANGCVDSAHFHVSIYQKN